MVVEPIRILIVDGNDDFRTGLQQSLAGRYLVQACTDGQEAMQMLEQFRPHILITELLLRYVDGVSLIHYAAQLSAAPSTLVVTIFSNDFIRTELESLGVCGVIMKPAGLHTVSNQIRQIAERINPVYSQRSAAYVTKLLQQLGIPQHRDGCTQLKAAIPLYADRPSLPLNKVIYEKVAQSSGFSSARQVEHSIRMVIQAGWNKTALWAELFPRGKPSNKIFISRLAELLNEYLCQPEDPSNQ